MSDMTDVHRFVKFWEKHSGEDMKITNGCIVTCCSCCDGETWSGEMFDLEGLVAELKNEKV